MSNQREKLWSLTFVAVIAFSFAGFIVIQGMNAGTTVFVDRMGGTSTFAGFLATMYTAAAAVTRLVAGPMVDTRGRFVVMMAGSIVLVVATVIPVVNSSDVALVVCRVLQGLGFSAANTATATVAADVLPYSRVGEGMSYYGLGQAVAMSIGPALGLFLVSTDPATNLFLGLSFAALLPIALAMACRYERNVKVLPETSTYRRRVEQREAELAERTRLTEQGIATDDAQEQTTADDQYKGIWKILEPGALPGALPLFLISPAFGFSIFFVGVIGTTYGIVNPGLYFTLSAVSMILVRFGSNRYMDALPAIVTYTGALACGLVAFVLLFLITTMGLPEPTMRVMLYVAGPFYGVCLGVATPVDHTVAIKCTKPERWGATNALFLFSLDLALGVSSIIWGIVNDNFGFGASIIGVIGCIIASYVCAWIIYPAPEKKLRKG